MYFSTAMRKTDILKDPLFISGLLLLILNDHALKALLHNQLTGKLSDFAGLFIFPAFWSYFFPKYRKGIYILTGLFFTFWKSELATSFITALNSISIAVSRVVDHTDLIALYVLPVSYYYFLKNHSYHLSKSVSVYLISAISFIAFCATSAPYYHFKQPYEYYSYYPYRTRLTMDDILHKLDSCGIQCRQDTFYDYRSSYYKDSTGNKVIVDTSLGKTAYWVIEDYKTGTDSFKYIYFQFDEYENAKSEVVIRGFNLYEKVSYDPKMINRKRKILRKTFAPIFKK